MNTRQIRLTLLISSMHTALGAEGNAPASEKPGSAGWQTPIDKLVAMTRPDQITRTDIFDRHQIDCWVDERAVLLGDAAHPMTPNLGMGACQAIKDAVVLANALGCEPIVEAALARYQTCRITRANSFVERSFRFGQVRAHRESAASLAA